MIEYYKNLSLESLFYINNEGLVCQEEWKDIPNYEGLYKISNLGRVKSLSRKMKRGFGFYFSKEIIIKQCLIDKGYPIIALAKNSINKRFHSHILMAISFLNHKPCGFKIVVDHINNIKYDNRLSNLQLTTNRENSSKDKKNYLKKTCVYFDNGKYRVRLKYKGKSICLGYFNTKELAYNTYLKVINLIKENKDISNYIKLKTPKSGVKNINIYKKKYRVAIVKNKKTILIGYFKTLEEAKIALDNYNLKSLI